MAFNESYYIKVGDYPIPLKYMFKGSYKVSVNTQDLDSYRDGNGKLHRNVLPHQADKLEFEVPYTTVKQFRTLMDNLRQQMINKVERNVELRYYNPESDSYETGSFYMPGTMEYEMFNKNIYMPFRIAFIEY